MSFLKKIGKTIGVALERGMIAMSKRNQPQLKRNLEERLRRENEPAPQYDPFVLDHFEKLREIESITSMPLKQFIALYPEYVLSDGVIDIEAPYNSWASDFWLKSRKGKWSKDESECWACWFNLSMSRRLKNEKEIEEIMNGCYDRFYNQELNHKKATR